MFPEDTATTSTDTARGETAARDRAAFNERYPTAESVAGEQGATPPRIQRGRPVDDPLTVERRRRAAGRNWRD